MSILNSKEWIKIKSMLVHSEYCIAGGYARDMHFGREPKDMDIGVFNLDVTDIVNIVSLLEAYDLIVESYIDEDELMQAHYEGNHIAGIVTCVGDIDLIFCNKEVTTAGEWINTFDYNINQFLLVEDEPIFIGENYGTLHFYNSNTNRANKCIERRDKMVKLADDAMCGWVVPDFVRDFDIELEINKFRSESST